MRSLDHVCLHISAATACTSIDGLSVAAARTGYGSPFRDVYRAP